MSNDSLGVALSSDTVRLERVLPGPIERVWSYLTDSDLRGQWLASGKMDLRVGGQVELNFMHATLSPQPEKVPEQYRGMERGHRMQGRITRIDEPRLLSYSWGESAGESEVTFELTPQGKDVLFVITHRKLPSRDEMLNTAGGWHTHVGILIDRLNGRTPPGFWTRFTQLRAQYEQKLPQQ